MRKVLFMFALLMATTMTAAEKKFTSPDGKMTVTVSDEGGKPTYRVQLYMNGALNTAKLSKKKVLKVEMPSNGGVVIIQ